VLSLASLIGGGLESLLSMELDELIEWYKTAKELEHERSS